MKRNPYVVERLNDWALWMARRQDGGGRGSNGVSSIYSGRERVACASNAPAYAVTGEDDAQAAEIDGLLVELGKIDRAAQAALIQVHWKGQAHSATINARIMGIGRNALHERCCRGDAYLDRRLREKRDPNFRTNTSAA